MPFKGKQPREGSEHLRMDVQWLTGGGGGQPQTSKSYEKMMENHYKMHPPPPGMQLWRLQRPRASKLGVVFV